MTNEPLLSTLIRIYVVEDDVVLLQAIRQVLVRDGYEVKTAVSGQEMLKMVRVYGLPHLMLVDLNLPDIDGLELIKTIQQFSDIPAIMLTAVYNEPTVANGLANYLDDYITKPFRTNELTARIRRTLRRMQTFNYVNDPILFVDIDLQIDLSNRTAYAHDQAVSLSPTETKLLNILMKHAERTVSYEFLLRRIWPRGNATEDRLHTNIYRLRKKLERNPKEPKYIRSHWGTGYIFSWGNSA